MPIINKIETNGYLKFDTFTSESIAHIYDTFKKLHSNKELNEKKSICCPHFIDYNYVEFMSFFAPCLQFLRGYELSPYNEISISTNFHKNKDDFGQKLPKGSPYSTLLIFYYIYKKLPIKTQPTILELNHNGKQSNITWYPGQTLVCLPDTDYTSSSQDTSNQKVLIKQILVHSKTAYQSSTLERLTHAIRKCKHRDLALKQNRPISLELRPYSTKKDSLGVFTTQPIRKGDLILTESLGKAYILNSRQDAMKSCFANHAEEIGKNRYIINFSLSSFINHSCQPNTGVIIDDPIKRKLVALEDIPSKTEITIDYSLTSVSEFGREDSWRFDCQCGSLNCRGEVTGNILNHQELLPIALNRSGIYVKTRIIKLLNIL